MAEGVMTQGASQGINWAEHYIERLAEDMKALRGMDERMRGMEERLNAKIDSKIDSKIDALESRLNNRMDRLDNRMDRLDNRMDSTEKHVRNIGVTILVGIVAAIITIGGLAYNVTSVVR